jgi:ribosome-associated protein
MATTPKQQVQQLLAAAVAACEDRKAEDIRILALDPSESGLTDYFLICSGNSDRQNVAITDAIEIKLKHEFGTYPNSVEGRRQGDWILMDYVDFIVHVFSAEKRAFYGLERLRKTATVLSIDELNSEIKAAIATTRSKAPAAAKTTAARKTVVGRKTLPVKKSAAKKAAAKKSALRKSPAKKAPSTKDAARAAATTRSSSVKTASKKATPAKKVATKKTVVKKAAPKKPTAKKA